MGQLKIQGTNLKFRLTHVGNEGKMAKKQAFNWHLNNGIMSL